MGVQINPGNILPVYEDEVWQRHRWEGCDNGPYGIPCANTRPLPFSFPTDQGLLDYFFVQLYDSNDVLTLVWASSDGAPIETFCTADGNYVLFSEHCTLSPVTPGYYYYRIAIGTKVYKTDYIHMQPMALGDNVTMQIYSCVDAGPGQATFNLTGVSCVGCSIESDIIEMWNLTSWEEVASGVLNTSAPSVDLRRVVRLSGSYTLTTYYTLTWNGAACSSGVLTETSRTNSQGQNGFWKIEATNTNDKEGVIYQTGWHQTIWIRPTFAPVEIVPSEKPNEDGEGNTIIESARVVERWKFEVPRLPNYTLFPLTILRYLDSVTLIGNTVNDEIAMTNYHFDYDLDGACLNKGLFSFDNAIEVFSGCDEDKTPISCT